MEKEEFIQFFIALEKAGGERNRRLQEMPVHIREGTQRLGRFFRALRGMCGLTRRELALRADAPFMWIVLLEEGLLLPSELTKEALNRVDRVFRENGPPILRVLSPRLFEFFQQEISTQPEISDWKLWETEHLPSLN